MNKNIFIILAIFLVPLAVYWGLTRDKLTTPPANEAQNIRNQICGLEVPAEKICTKLSID